MNPGMRGGSSTKPTSYASSRRAAPEPPKMDGSARVEPNQNMLSPLARPAGCEYSLVS